MVTALAFKREGRVLQVANLDLDDRWGDGTHGVIQHLGLHWVSHGRTGPEVPTASAADQRMTEIASAWLIP